jgi:diadenosine tetraphosphate (Ap4A) HIT family hydrolase
MCSGAECPICARGKPLHIVAELEAAWLTMPEAAVIAGYVCLVARAHAVELHDLPEPVAVAFMRDAQRVSRVLSRVTGAIKLNYEIHGNSLPHLHMHLYPRHRGDRFEGRPIDPASSSQSPYSAGELEAMRDNILVALGGIGHDRKG